MFKLLEPSRSSIDRFLLDASRLDLSYTEIGSTRGQAPRDYGVDHNRVRLGSGEETFRRAVAALRAWEMFNLGWVRLFEPGTPIEVDRTVAIVVHHFGFWSMNSCRVVYVIDEERRFGFAYGTLRQHAEQGEERFSVEWEAESDSVFYDILAFSKPRQWQARVARPLSRRLQKRFARDSLAAMKRAVEADAAHRSAATPHQ